MHVDENEMHVGEDGQLTKEPAAAKRTKGMFRNLYTDGFIGDDGNEPGVSTNVLFAKGPELFL